MTILKKLFFSALPEWVGNGLEKITFGGYVFYAAEAMLPPKTPLQRASQNAKQ
jgi:hypothetical protein